MRHTMIRFLSCLAGLLLLSSGVRADVLADKVPGDAILYVSWAGTSTLQGQYAQSRLKEILDASTFQRYLDQPDLPPVDLLIRTAGEIRLSNFLLWESAYAEFYFSGKYWPDWNEDDLRLALKEYQKRQRKFGGLNE